MGKVALGGGILAADVTARRIRVVIDPGHGGDAPGAVGHGLREADVNLEVARLVADQLPVPPYIVTLTRNADVTVPLSMRPAIASEHKACLFVSLHCNAACGVTASGFEVFHYPHSVEGQRLARLIHQSTAGVFTVDRGIKSRAGLCVLRETKCPAVLVEMGFISNPAEAKRLASSEFKLCLAKAIARGIAAYRPPGA
jgi:N-acetylmuramoyl-L-alanine amidase